METRVAPDEVGRDPIDRERRFVYLLLLVCVLPRVIFSNTINDGAAALLVWSAMALALMRRRRYRIPRAIVWRRDVILSPSCRQARGVRSTMVHARHRAGDAS
jgi:uncharacterized protein (TIGR03382 family)